MGLGALHSIKILAPGNSLRRRVAYSMALVRLILAPVIFLAVYYLFELGRIVDRIVSVDAPATTLAEQASIEMLEARRAERNYLLLRDPEYLQANSKNVAGVREKIQRIQGLETQDQPVTEKALRAVAAYEQQFADAVSTLGSPEQPTADRFQSVVRAYEKDLNELLKRGTRESRARLLEELRGRVESFDAQISKTVQDRDPALRQITAELQNSSREILESTAALERSGLRRIQEDHRHARQLITNAEWALGCVSVLTLLFSIWVSFILPRQVAKPLVSLTEAVDRAAAGDYTIDFTIEGQGEVAKLAKSVRNLVQRIQRQR
jgi:HAMP domain-containing protein